MRTTRFLIAAAITLFIFPCAYAQDTSTPSPRTLGILNTSAMNLHGPEDIRSHLLSILDSASNARGDQFDAQYHQRIANVRLFVMSASPEEVVRFATELRPQYAEWVQSMSDATPNRNALRVTVNATCTGNDFTKGLCEMGNILDSLTSVYAALPGAVVETVTQIKGTFENIVDALPPPGALIPDMSKRLKLSNSQLMQAAQIADTYVRLPCPAAGMDLPGFGKVGEIRTFTNFAGTVGFAGNTIQDVTPSDILTSVNLQAVAVVANFPVQWLSRCLESSWNEAHDTAESNHHAFVEATLDVTVSSRASQVNVNSAQTEIANVTMDVAKVEAKLDRLGPALDDIEATTQRIIQNADRLEATSLRHDATADRIESKVDRLKIQQGETSDLFAGLEKAQLRMLIEADLVRQSNTRIALFQLPESIGGYLELVRSIVDETLQRRGAAGIDVRTARSAFEDAVREYGFRNYKNAYSGYRKAYQKAVN